MPASTFALDEVALRSLAGAIDASSYAVVTLDKDGIIRAVNAAAARMLGYLPEEVIGWMPITAFHDPTELARRAGELTHELAQDVPSGLPALVARATRGLRDEHGWTWVRKDGSRIPVHLSIAPQHDSGGAVIGYVVFGFDIAPMRQIEVEVNQLRQALEEAVDGIARLDAQGRFMQVNTAYARALGRSQGELRGQSWEISVAPDERERVERIIAAMRRTGERAHSEVRGEHADGTDLYHLVVLTPLYAADGAYDGCFWFSSDISEQKRIDAQRVVAERALRAANQELVSSVAELQQRNQQVVLLSEMSDLLQSCLSDEEAYRVIGQFAGRIFTEGSGAIGVSAPERNLIETVAAFGDSPPEETVYLPDACWAVRRGRVHVSASEHSGVRCSHYGRASTGMQICVPMMAQGEALGALHWTCDAGDSSVDRNRQLAVSVGEHIALALANFRLRETLRTQSVRDGLTGLFNRRYLDETLDREVRRAARHGRKLGVMMIDVDHFKRFNDTYGHEAGDQIMRLLGDFLKRQIRIDDVACRYGGEEFTMVLVEAAPEIVRQRAERIREGVRQLALQTRGRGPVNVTVSIGVATYPEDANSAVELLRAADTALYFAKQSGRDRVAAAADVPPGHPLAAAG